jgi:hypothetical protein
MMNLDDLYESFGASVEGPMPLLILTDGWIEASDTVARVHELIVHHGDLEVIAEFDTDQLLDQRARRPLLTVIDGVMDHVTWPRLQLAVGTDADDRPFLLLHGPEPDFRWRPFGKAVATIASGIGVTTTYTMGAYPAPMPHTRPTRISSTASSATMLVGREHTTGSIVVPVGVFAAVTSELEQFDVPSHGLWAQVPYYISTIAWPQSSLAMLAELESVAGLRFEASSLEAQVAEALIAVEAMMNESPSLHNVVVGLERRYDELKKLEDSGLPTGDELEEELQKYLRKIDGD